MAYFVSKEAERDILLIGRYTQNNWGVDQRREYLSGIKRKFEFLAKNPKVCRQRNELNPPVRIHQHAEHLIVYMLIEKDILIVRVLHNSMDISSLDMG